MSWDDSLPDKASVAAAAVAIVVRASLQEKPRPWRVVLLDGISTAGLSFTVYHGAMGLPSGLGGPLNNQFAFCLSVFAAVLGWAAVTRWIWRRYHKGEDQTPAPGG